MNPKTYRIIRTSFRITEHYIVEAGSRVEAIEHVIEGDLDPDRVTAEPTESFLVSEVSPEEEIGT